MREIQVIPVNRQKKETTPKKKSLDYKDKVIVGELFVIVAMAILLYIAQAGPIW